MTTVYVAGSTGSIGRQALEVLAGNPMGLEIDAISAARSVEALAAQAAAVHPRAVGLADTTRAADLADLLPRGTELVTGPEALAELAGQADVVLNAVVGFAGLPVTLAALEAGRRLALANKESLIAAGPVVQVVRSTPGAELVPVDSEHSAIHQCLRSGVASEVARLVLTASGGPFRGRGRAELASVDREGALAHPTWRMGPKVTIDSSTLMNKGLEVIEAHELFGVGFDRIEVVVHPQSVVHSMVEFRDGATIAQLSLPDMRLPIGYALGWPERLGRPFGTIDWLSMKRLDFEQPDLDAFACLGLAFEAGRRGGTAPAWLNGANEVAVEAFLGGRIPWLGIAEVVEEALGHYEDVAPRDIADVLAADAEARRRATSAIERRWRAA